MAILYLKAVHIIFVVSWFAGLFYLVRLFIYHVEAEDRPEPERQVLQDQYSLMERRLWRIITQPSMLLTIGTGIAMIYVAPSYLSATWMWVKLGFVVLLLVYHFLCGRMLAQLQRGVMPGSSLKLRMWNEVATLLLVAIVFLVVLRHWLDWVWGTATLVGLALIFMVIVKAAQRRWKE